MLAIKRLRLGRSFSLSFFDRWLLTPEPSNPAHASFQHLISSLYLGGGGTCGETARQAAKPAAATALIGREMKFGAGNQATCRHQGTPDDRQSKHYRGVHLLQRLFRGSSVTHLTLQTGTPKWCLRRLQRGGWVGGAPFDGDLCHGMGNFERHVPDAVHLRVHSPVSPVFGCGGESEPHRSNRPGRQTIKKESTEVEVRCHLPPEGHQHSAQ